MRMGQAAWFDSETERGKVTRRCGVFAALGWVILEAFFELLFGPHLRLVRSLAIGSGLGVAAGLLTSALQWLALRGHMRDAGALIPVTTLGSTLAGLAGGLFLYYINRSVDLYSWNIPLQGAFGAVFVGLVTARLQWVVLRKWVVPGHGWRTWLSITTAGSILGVACACAAAAAVTGLFGSILERRIWPYVLIAAYLMAGVTGGAIYGLFITRGLRQVLVGATAQAEQPL